MRHESTNAMGRRFYWPDGGPVHIPAGVDPRHLDQDPQYQLGIVHDGGAPGHQGPLELGHLVQRPPALHTLGPHLGLGRDVPLSEQLLPSISVDKCP